MEIWVLTLWSLAVSPMEGGQYVTRERCQAAAPAIARGLRAQYGALYWRCETISRVAPRRSMAQQRAAGERFELVAQAAH
jgi:hypothetical protein